MDFVKNTSVSKVFWASVELHIIGGRSGLNARFSGLNVWKSENLCDFVA